MARKISCRMKSSWNPTRVKIGRGWFWYLGEVDQPCDGLDSLHEDEKTRLLGAVVLEKSSLGIPVEVLILVEVRSSQLNVVTVRSAALWILWN